MNTTPTSQDATGKEPPPQPESGLAASFNSMEGVPDWPLVTPETREEPLAWQRALNRGFAWIGPMLPGVVLAFVVARAGKHVAHWIGIDLLGFEKSPVSEIMIAILLGLVLRNVCGLPEVYEKGLRLCLKRILRIGIALLGIRLSLAAAAQLGGAGLPVVLICLGAGLLLVTRFSAALGLPRRLGSLIAVGTSICGATAIVATGSAIEADDDEVSYAVACITIFGLAAMFAYPLLAHWLFAESQACAGLFLGTSIHETAQVAGAGLIYEQQYDAPKALDAAVVTKLVRNLCMIWVIPLVAVMYRRSDGATGQTAPWYRAVPLFVVGFLAMSLLRTVGDAGVRQFGFLEKDTWDGICAAILSASKWCLIVAMAAVGLGTSLRRLKELGWKPFLVGLVAAVLVGCVSILMIELLAPWIPEIGS